MQAGTVSGLLTLQETSKTRSQHQLEFCAYLEVTRLFPQGGCARNKLLFRTVQRNLRLSRDAGPRMDGIPALDLWDLVIEVLHSTSNQLKKSKTMCRESCCVTHHQENTPRTKLTLPIQYNDLELCNVDYVSSNVKSSQFGAVLHIFEDNEAVINMIIKGRSPTMRHSSRSHRVAHDGLFDRINLDKKSKSNMLTPKTNSQTS